MQDNARCHVSRETKAWLERQNIPIMDWPPYSPDLNPLENLWGILSNIVYSHGKQYHTIQELGVAVKTTWSNIRIEHFQTLSMSMPNRFMILFWVKVVILNINFLFLSIKCVDLYFVLTSKPVLTFDCGFNLCHYFLEVFRKKLIF